MEINNSIEVMMKNNSFVSVGFLIPIVFWLTILICGSITENYSHYRNLVSELGAIGTSTRYLFTAGLITCSILSILFIISLYRIAKKNQFNTIPIFILFTFAFSIAGAGLFPMPLKLHEILGFPSTFLCLSPLTSFLLWKNISIPNIRFFAFLIFVIMASGFLIYVPNFLDNYFGLKQRFFHFGWTIWFIYLSVVFNNNDPLKISAPNNHQVQLPVFPKN